MGYSPWGCKELDTTEVTQHTRKYSNYELQDGGKSYFSIKGTRVTIIAIIYCCEMEKAMATRSGILAWRIPGTEEPGGLPSMGSHRVGHD